MAAGHCCFGWCLVLAGRGCSFCAGTVSQRRHLRYDGRDVSGQNLNILADHLSHAIRELEQTNEKLARDLDVQREVDAMRKAFIAAASHE